VVAPFSKPEASSDRRSLGGFVTRAFLGVLVVGFAFLLWRLRDAIAIGLGAVVLAIGYRGLASALTRRTRLPIGACLALVVIVTLGVVALSLEIFGATLAAQFGLLFEKLPQAANDLQARFGASPLGRDVLAQARSGLLALLTGSGAKVAAGVLSATAQALAYGLVMIAGSVFLAVDPERYHRGLLILMPRRRRDHYDQILAALADALRRWLFSRLVVMAATGAMLSLALWLLGIDAPVALGLTGAVLSFIPNVGSIMAALPALLIAFLQEPVKAVWVGAVLWAVYFVEGNFITPYIQDEAVDVPPVISIFSTIVLALLLGPVGVFLSGPITVVALVLVHRLYIEDVLGEPPAIGRKSRHG
jgi:predicted PurR-regulated permease PerM